MIYRIAVFIMLFSSIIFSQYNIDYSIRVYHLGDSQYDIIENGSTIEGGYILFPPYQLTGDIEPYQNLYDVVKGSTLRFDDGALNENIKIYLYVMSFDSEASGYYFDHNLFFYMGAQVQGQRSGFHDFDDIYQLQSEKYAYLRIPKDDDLNAVLEQIHLNMSDIDFAYHTRDGYNQNGIKYTELTDSLQCRLSHFSKFGGGRGGILPVELTEFTANYFDGKVVLRWETATEHNNYGFEILRRNKNGSGDDWKTLGFVQGNGTSNSANSYSFTDNEVSPGNYYYILRQIDLDGQVNYSSKIEVFVPMPQKFELYQNYPNPFSAKGGSTTTISYVIARSEATRQSTGNLANANNSTVRLARSFTNDCVGVRNDDVVHVSLKIYDALGREVATLVNKEQTPGKYSVQFDGSSALGGLPSGIYFYTLRAGNFSATKKLILMK